jgi:flagellar hook assembly protein FlgD
MKYFFPLFLALTALSASADVVMGESGDFFLGSESKVRLVTAKVNPHISLVASQVPYRLHITITGLKAGNSVRLNIRNLKGQTIIGLGYRAQGSELAFTWDATKASGQKLNSGYLIADLVLPDSRTEHLIQVP